MIIRQKSQNGQTRRKTEQVSFFKIFCLIGDLEIGIRKKLKKYQRCAADARSHINGLKVANCSTSYIHQIRSQCIFLVATETIYQILFLNKILKDLKNGMFHVFSIVPILNFLRLDMPF